MYWLLYNTVSYHTLPAAARWIYLPSGGLARRCARNRAPNRRPVRALLGGRGCGDFQFLGAWKKSSGLGCSPDECCCWRRCRCRRSLHAVSDCSEPSVAEPLRPSHEHAWVRHTRYACGRVARASGRCCTCIGTFISMHKPVALGRPAGEGVGARFLRPGQAAWTCGKRHAGCVQRKA